jgi:hypothetical protein
LSVILNASHFKEAVSWALLKCPRQGCRGQAYRDVFTASSAELKR